MPVLGDAGVLASCAEQSRRAHKWKLPALPVSRVEGRGQHGQAGRGPQGEGVPRPRYRGFAAWFEKGRDQWRPMKKVWLKRRLQSRL